MNIMWEDWRIQIGLNIRMLRRSLRMTQEELAARAGCSRQTISGLERAENSMSADMLFSLCRALHCSAKDILSLE